MEQDNAGVLGQLMGTDVPYQTLPRFFEPDQLQNFTSQHDDAMQQIFAAELGDPSDDQYMDFMNKMDSYFKLKEMAQTPEFQEQLNLAVSDMGQTTQQPENPYREESMR